MKFSSGLSTRERYRPALDEACQIAREALGEEAAHLALVFVTPPLAGPGLDELPGRVKEVTGAARILGCTGEGIVGGGREVEEDAAVSVLLAHLPGVTIRPFALDQEDLQAIEETEDLAGPLGVKPAEEPIFLVIGEPFSFDARGLLDGINDIYPGRPVIGGMASGGSFPGENRLFVGADTLEDGVVGVALTGNLRVETIVSQGCRPVGKHLVITKAKKSVIYEIGGKRSSKALGQVLASLGKDDQKRARAGIHIGRVINENQAAFRRGDFLVRNLIGVDPETGAIAVGDHFRPGQTIQFHIRDRDAAREDLRVLLEEFREREGAGVSTGGLLFSCNGRGKRLFGEADHDSTLIREILGDLPLGGFFCAGEIGPIGGKNFLHGFTDSIALFLPR